MQMNKMKIALEKTIKWDKWKKGRENNSVLTLSNQIRNEKIEYIKNGVFRSLKKKQNRSNSNDAVKTNKILELNCPNKKQHRLTDFFAE